ncbi:MAG TPA: pyrroline-5-carboxylate reductase [Woeseiaceae bacterium]|nr:pyrroline-5-carboxylate reductase [Woeseiaceae bacterium]
MTDDIAFIGGGNMARAIACGLVASGLPQSRLRIAEPNASARDALAADLPGARIDADNDAIAAGAATLVLAVKPQVLPYVCHGLAATVQAERPLVVSIAAGVRCGDIDAWLGGGLAIVRVMPNQPALLRQGVTGVYGNPRTGAAELERATAILAAVGKVVVVAEERDLDTVTAVSGSGPAYFYLLTDVLSKAAVELGIDAAAARTLAVETLVGAAALAGHTDESMDTLIARVRSPGGTTAAALDFLEQRDARAIFAAAIRAARYRAEQLADQAHESAAD